VPYRITDPLRDSIAPLTKNMMKSATSGPVHDKAIPIPDILPHAEIYTLKIGYKTFTLSGLSLSYDGPSYFTDYFNGHRMTNELFVDRNPVLFEKIYMHLQGYSVEVRNDFEYTALIIDAGFFRLEKLKNRLLQEPFHITVGGRLFKIPKELLTQKGNFPNYFSILYNNTLEDPYSHSQNLMFARPPPMTPHDSAKSPDILEALLDGLRGKTIEIKSEEHRRNLLEDCRYYQFIALEQKIIKYQIHKNPFTGHDEILIGLNDIKPNGLLNDTMGSMIDANSSFTTIKYSRPHVDRNVYRDLIIQLDSSEVNLMVNATLTFYNLLIVGETAVKLKRILSKVTDDYIYEMEKGIPKLTVLIQMDESVGKLNGLDMEKGWLDTLISVNNENMGDQAMNGSNGNFLQCSPTSSNDPTRPHKIIVIKILQSQWTINVQGRSKIWMNCLLFDGVLDKSHFNRKRKFL
jgi:hypothetical protein